MNEDKVQERISEKPIEAAALTKENKDTDSKDVNEQSKSLNMPSHLMPQDFTQFFSNLKEKAMQSPLYSHVIENGGRSYEGEIVDAKKHGVGTLFTENGETYEGQWKDNQMEGFGRYNFSNGDIYVGSFVRGKPNGHGKKHFSYTRNIYEGNWKEGKAIGQGTFYISSEEKVFKGEFWDCSLHGFGQMTSSAEKYIG